MQIVLLSGGSGKRLWPLSNGIRSKQFLKVLRAPSGEWESMVQRVYRQIREAGINAQVTVATSANQKDSIISQLDDKVDIVTEPERRDTFPAIALCVTYLNKVKHIDPDETIIVMPCDVFADSSYFDKISQIAKEVESNKSDLVLMGIVPTYPSSKFGYIMPNRLNPGKIDGFMEKPTLELAKELIQNGAVWNGGVFGFKLGYLIDKITKYFNAQTFDEFIHRYAELPKISFDYEIVEKTSNLSGVYYKGRWKDLGTWNALSEELSSCKIGNVIQSECLGTTTINELSIPILCQGTNNLIVAASPDGILVADKSKSEDIKDGVNAINSRPMYEERRWGSYKVIDNVEFKDGFCALTKQLMLNPGCSISYQRHSYRDEVWTFIDGSGEIVIDEKRSLVKRGDVIIISRGTLHALRAVTSLTFIEVQRGENLVEEDIERFEYNWG